MIEFYVARALQIMALEINNLDMLHSIERKTGWPLPNWNIQAIFNTGPLKDFYGAPNDEEAIALWRSRCEKQIKELGLAKTESREFPRESNIDAIHEFDFNIFNARDKLNFYYSGKQKTERLLDRVMKDK